MNDNSSPSTLTIASSLSSRHRDNASKHAEEEEEEETERGGEGAAEGMDGVRGTGRRDRFDICCSCSSRGGAYDRQGVEMMKGRGA